MAAITAVASACTSGVQPRYAVQGLVSVYSEYTITATMSTGDIVEICKLPDGARVQNIQIGIPNTFHVNAKLNVGTVADHDKFIVSATCNSSSIRDMTNFGDGSALGIPIDVTDSATTKYTLIRMKVSDADSTTGTTAGVLRFLVTYYNEAPY